MLMKCRCDRLDQVLMAEAAKQEQNARLQPLIGQVLLGLSPVLVSINYGLAIKFQATPEVSDP